jgi:hypothetical protein
LNTWATTWKETREGGTATASVVSNLAGIQRGILRYPSSSVPVIFGANWIVFNPDTHSLHRCSPISESF